METINKFPEKTFREWFNNHLSEYSYDLSNHGAIGGFPYITYTQDCVEIFDQYQDEIWDYAVEQAQNMGEKNVLEMISKFQHKHMMNTINDLKTLILWYVCEEFAFEYELGNDDELESEE